MNVCKTNGGVQLIPKETNFLSKDKCGGRGGYNLPSSHHSPYGVPHRLGLQPALEEQEGKDG